MKRFCSQILVCSQKDIRQNTMIELDENNKVQQIQDITTLQSETAQTAFYNGIISAGIISLSKYIEVEKINHDEYLYINLHTDFTIPELNSDKRVLIIDGATEELHEFNSILQANYERLKHLSILEIIAASCYNSAEALGTNNEISKYTIFEPLLWKNCNLVTKSLTQKTEIVYL